MQNTVPALTIIFILLDMLMGVLLPLGLYIFLRKKYACGHAPFWVGCAVMAVFALILERLAHGLILGSALGAVIQGNIWLYGLYGGLMAGLFEEGGRYLAFKTVLRGSRGNDHNALMYGAGHGGFEAFYLLIFGMVNNLVFSLAINRGGADALTASLSGDALLQVQAGMAQLVSAPPWMFLVTVIERLAALTAQLALSVLVWFAAKNGGRSALLLPLAILLHLLLDAGAAIMSRYVSQVLLIELAVWMFAIICVLTARAVWIKNKPPQSPASGDAE